ASQAAARRTSSRARRCSRLAPSRSGPSAGAGGVWRSAPSREIQRPVARLLLGSTAMNEKPRFGFVVEYVRDIEAAKQFYVESFGLKVERTHPMFVQFEHFAIASDDSLGPGK